MATRAAFALHRRISRHSPNTPKMLQLLQLSQPTLARTSRVDRLLSHASCNRCETSWSPKAHKFPNSVMSPMPQRCSSYCSWYTLITLSQDSRSPGCFRSRPAIAFTLLSPKAHSVIPRCPKVIRCPRAIKGGYGINRAIGRLLHLLLLMVKHIGLLRIFF